MTGRASTSTKMADRLALVTSTVVVDFGHEEWGPWTMVDVSDLATT
jgi:hypothetical protein